MNNVCCEVSYKKIINREPSELPKTTHRNAELFNLSLSSHAGDSYAGSSLYFYTEVRYQQCTVLGSPDKQKMLQRMIKMIIIIEFILTQVMHNKV